MCQFINLVKRSQNHTVLPVPMEHLSLKRAYLLMVWVQDNRGMQEIKACPVNFQKKKKDNVFLPPLSCNLLIGRN